MTTRRIFIRPHAPETRCLVAPHPDVIASMREQLEALRANADDSAAAAFLTLRKPQAFGFDDGAILPPDEFDLGTAPALMREAAAARGPLRGNLNVVVVLVEFPDASLGHVAADYDRLFFSGPNSVNDYYREVSGGLIGIT